MMFCGNCKVICCKEKCPRCGIQMTKKISFTADEKNDESKELALVNIPDYACELCAKYGVKCVKCRMTPIGEKKNADDVMCITCNELPAKFKYYCIGCYNKKYSKYTERVAKAAKPAKTAKSGYVILCKTKEAREILHGFIDMAEESKQFQCLTETSYEEFSKCFPYLENLYDAVWVNTEKWSIKTNRDIDYLMIYDPYLLKWEDEIIDNLAIEA